MFHKKNWPVWLKHDNRLHEITCLIFDHKNQLVVLSTDKEDSEIPYWMERIKDERRNTGSDSDKIST